ncbi:hypothetical protein BASA81_008543 [Batrachochytrium salamandrivorans]|nr:hypothetical protein BASA81_008543 [Batrachochytrium salamandrivorans]
MSKQQETVDLVVVGFGMAGASAAMQALESAEAAGTKPNILLVDRFEGGGATSRSAGIVYFGGGTDLQRKFGVDDDVENFYEYMKIEAKGAVSEETLWRFCETSPQCAAWIRDSFQAKFNIKEDDGAKLYHLKTSVSAEQYSLQFSGNETAHPYTVKARAVQRGHKAYGPGGSYVGYGNLLFADLERGILKCKPRGLHVETFTRCTELVREGDRVVACKLVSMANAPFWARLVHAKLAYFGGLTQPVTHLEQWIQSTCDSLERNYGTERLVHTTNGVVLCAGGFGRSDEHMRQHLPKYHGAMPLGSIADDGEGIFKLGVKDCNAKTGFLSNGIAWKFITPAQAMAKGVLVNKHGVRSCNEESYGATLARSIIVENGGTGEGFLVIDQTLANECWEEMRHGEMLWLQIGQQLLQLCWNRVKCNTLEELAKETGCGQQLVDTITEYNAQCKQGRDDVKGKRSTLLSAIETGPFYAFKFHTHGTMWFTPYFSLGGLSVDETSGLVLDAQTSQPIAGLYAAGRNAVGVCSQSYVSGLSLSDAVFSGRRAAMHAMSGQIFGAKAKL